MLRTPRKTTIMAFLALIPLVTRSEGITVRVNASSFWIGVFALQRCTAQTMDTETGEAIRVNELWCELEVFLDRFPGYVPSYESKRNASSVTAVNWSVGLGRWPRMSARACYTLNSTSKSVCTDKVSP